MAESKEKLVKIRIPHTPGRKNEEPLFVSVNERTWLIQIGKEVEVPECVAEVLRNREEAMERSYAFEQEMAD